MSVTVQQVCRLLEGLAPLYLAEKWDNVGLQVGDPKGKVERLLVTLSVTEEVLEEAKDKSVDMIISHHPLIFEPLKRLRDDTPLGHLLREMIRREIALYVCHTNVDVAEGGLNSWLAEKLGLVDVRVLQETYREELNKLVVFVPKGHEDKVMDKMAAAGAGWIGTYSHCTFQVQGTGTFKPLSGASPFIGEVGRVERVDEVRIETIIEGRIRDRVVDAMLSAHPYEEVAYDIYPLRNRPATVHGLGRIGRLEREEPLEVFLERVRDNLKVEELRVNSQDMKRSIRRVALCGGSGADLMGMASSKGADLFLTGDVKYHDALKAREQGLILVDAGHDGTEKIMIEGISEYLLKNLKIQGADDIDVFKTQQAVATMWKFT